MVGFVAQAVDTVSQAIDVGGKAAEQVAAVLKALGEAVKPALPVLKSASDEALPLPAADETDQRSRSAALLAFNTGLSR